MSEKGIIVGHEIVYCAACLRQLRGPDFECGAALRIEGQAYCSPCSISVLKTVPGGEPRTDLRSATSLDDGRPKKKACARILPSAFSSPALPRVSRSSTPVSLTVASGLAGLVLIIVVTAILASAETPSRRDRDDAVPKAERKVSSAPEGDPRPPPASVSPPSTETPKEGRARESLRRAKEEAVRAGGGDLTGAILLLEATVDEARGTSCFSEAWSELERVRALDRQTMAAEWSRLDEQLGGLLRNEEFRHALDTLESLRQRRKNPEWSAGIERRLQDVHREADMLYSRIKAEALGAKGRGARQAVSVLEERIRKWGLARFCVDLTQSLAAVPLDPPVSVSGPGLLTFREEFERGPGNFTGGEIVEGGVGGSKALAISKGAVRIADVFTTEISPAVIIRFKVKPLCEAPVLSVLMWSNKIQDNYWYHVRGLKRGEWNVVEFRASDARGGYAMKGRDAVGDAPSWISVHIEDMAEGDRALLDDFEVSR